MLSEAEPSTLSIIAKTVRSLGCQGLTQKSWRNHTVVPCLMVKMEKDCMASWHFHIVISSVGLWPKLRWRSL
jgi:hypothetical protein